MNPTYRKTHGIARNPAPNPELTQSENASKFVSLFSIFSTEK